MREYLFRGKNEYNGEWAEGYFVHCKSIYDDESGRIAEIIPHDADRIYTGEYSSCDVQKVIFETVGQFTGLCDRNGKRIFEGDILSEGGYLFVVVWNQAWAQFRLQHIGRYIQYPEWNRGVQMEIVGNIHDNPELLEE